MRADTGKRIWHFQTVRHDLWDRDLPSPPSLVTVERDGKPVDAVAANHQVRLRIFFNRENGKPLFPIESRKVPPSDVEGEVAADTQPFPLLPPPFARQTFTERNVTRRTPEAHQAVLERLRELRSVWPVQPPALQGTVTFPGVDGGAEWGGAAFDPESHLLYVNANERVQVLKPARQQRRPSLPASYIANRGPAISPIGRGANSPSLGVGAKYSKAQIAALVRKGTGRMPAFSGPAGRCQRCANRVCRLGQGHACVAAGAGIRPSNNLKYKTVGYNRIVDPQGYPAVEPPWGT